MTKNNEFIAKKRFRTVTSPGACERLAVLNWRSSSIPSIYYGRRCVDIERTTVIISCQSCRGLSYLPGRQAGRLSDTATLPLCLFACPCVNAKVVGAFWQNFLSGPNSLLYKEDTVSFQE